MVVPLKGHSHFVLEGEQQWPVDKEYAQRGIKEGWLEFLSGVRSNGVYVCIYRLVGEEPPSPPKTDYTKSIAPEVRITDTEIG